ncbi:MAG: acetyl/propionyl/methylcrotonyl-CoA carboxylase subunit alpha [Pseudomonadota bacterium]
MITSLLIANRGEIACRIIRTARAMGVRTVAVYSDADATALHVRQADEAVHIGPSPARESYLVGEKIIAAAKQTGAEAIHPGYGFLSENADFAQAVIDANLIWVGPAPASIRAMGLKDAAKERMIAAGVPVTPGYLGADQRPDHLKAEADQIGYPVLIKAVAGGGGKGMRRVDATGDFLDALLSCQREAASSFGDDRVLIEKYILSPRHIEVQVFGDTHGNVVHLFERDCSLQRRHQKVIEEAPAPGMDAATRESICAAAVRAAQAVDYIGAGTIEFIADASEGLRADRIWFMEMNTRLQVEHPVTEEITGVDLVEWQLRVASGEPLPKRQGELSIDGWAIEARLYAEDPATGFLPSVGTLSHFYLCDYGPDDRIDTGVEEGDAISTFYDPMIAKLISSGEDREAARRNLMEVLARSYVQPVKTNGGFIFECLSHPKFISGVLSTAFIAEHAAELEALAKPGVEALENAACQLVADYPPKDRSYFEIMNGPIGFRLNRSPNNTLVFYHGRAPLLAKYRAMWTDPPHELGHAYPLDDETVVLVERGQSFLLSTRGSAEGAAGAAATGAILSPMPGRVIAVAVAAGDAVTKGQKLVTLEAMKMEHSLTAPFDGTVAELNAAEGGQVSEGTLLVRVEATPA